MNPLFFALLKLIHNVKVRNSIQNQFVVPLNRTIEFTINIMIVTLKSCPSKSKNYCFGNRRKQRGRNEIGKFRRINRERTKCYSRISERKKRENIPTELYSLH